MPWTPATAYCCAINVLLIIETALEHYCGNACPRAHPVVCPEACPEACPVVCPEISFGGTENLFSILKQYLTHIAQTSTNPIEPIILRTS